MQVCSNVNYIDIAVMPKSDIPAWVLGGLRFTEIQDIRAMFYTVKVFCMRFSLLCFTLCTACFIVTDLNSEVYEIQHSFNLHWHV